MVEPSAVLDTAELQVSAADAAAAAAQADVAAVQQRVYEIRAEAAMLVETVEDRAHEVRGCGVVWVGEGGLEVGGLGRQQTAALGGRSAFAPPLLSLARPAAPCPRR